MLESLQKYIILPSRNINKISYKKLILCDVSIMILCLVLLFIGTRLEEVSQGLFISICVLNFVYFLLSLINYFIKNKKIFTPYIFFYSSLYFFTFGQSCLYLFNIKHQSIQLFYYFFPNNGYLYYPLVFSTLCFVAFNCGQNIYISIKNKKKKESILENIEVKVLSPAFVEKYIYFLLIPTVVITLVTLITSLIYFIRFGYPEYLDVIPSIILLLNYYIKPIAIGCIFMALALEHKIRRKNLLFIVLFVLAVIDMFTGARTNGLSLILIIIWLKFFIEEKIDYKKAIYLMFIVAIIIIFVPLLAEIRTGEGTFSIQEFLDKNPMIEVIAEFGFSLLPVCLIMLTIPAQYNYEYGQTFLDAIVSILPDSIVNQFYQIHEMPAEWITNLYGADFGLGFNIFAELYWNFGYFGFIFAALLGVLICKSFYYHQPSDIKNNYLKYFNICMILYIIFTLPRRSMHEVAFPLFYFVVIPNLLLNYKIIVYFLKNKISRIRD